MSMYQNAINCSLWNFHEQCVRRFTIACVFIKNSANGRIATWCSWCHKIGVEFCWEIFCLIQDRWTMCTWLDHASHLMQWWVILYKSIWNNVYTVKRNLVTILDMKTGNICDDSDKKNKDYFSRNWPGQPGL